MRSKRMKEVKSKVFEAFRYDLRRERAGALAQTLTVILSVLERKLKFFQINITTKSFK